MHLRRITAALTVGVLAIAACGTSTDVVIKASNYDLSCGTAADCVVISEGSCCPQCQFAAISKNDSQYPIDEKKRQDACKGTKCALPPCAAPQIICSANKCGLCQGVCNNDDAGTPDAGTQDAKIDAPTD